MLPLAFFNSPRPAGLSSSNSDLSFYPLLVFPSRIRHTFIIEIKRYERERKKAEKSILYVCGVCMCVCVCVCVCEKRELQNSI